MPQLLALEWNGSEARLVVAASHGEKVIIEQAFSVALRARPSGEDPAEADVGGRIAAGLAARGIGRIDTLVAVGRSSIELRQLSLPPAPEDEVPDLVRFQAMREFNEFDEKWLLDFVPIDQPEEGQQTVLAAAIGPELVGQIEQTCQTAGLKPRRLILRPCAAASLLGRIASAGPPRPKLLVDLLSDEADLTVMVDRKVIFLRTARMSADPLQDADHARALLAEIRRTMMAAQNQLGGERVESIVLCGRDEQHAALAKSIEENLATPTELFDPFTGLNLSRELHRALPDHPGRFAPLLGMALAELEETGHAIDFLHPRRPAKPPRRRTKFIVAAVSLVLLVAMFFGYRHLYRNWLVGKIEALTQESESLKKDLDQAAEVQEAVRKIEQWTATDVVWLDELRELSEEFPPAKEAMLSQLTMAASAPQGKMELEGLVDTPLTIGPMQKDLRDQSHHVKATGDGADTSRKFYSWWFKASLIKVPEGQ